MPNMTKVGNIKIAVFIVCLVITTCHELIVNKWIISKASCQTGRDDATISMVHPAPNDLTRHQDLWDREHALLQDKAKCNRFSYFNCSISAGFGHRFGEIVMGMLLADKTNTTFVFDDTCWKHQGDHGGYNWFSDFFPIHETSISLSELLQYWKLTNSSTKLVEVHGTWSEVVENAVANEFEPSSCNTVYSSTWTMCPPPEYSCFESPIVGVYDDVKWRLRAIYSRSRFHPLLRLFDNSTANGALSVAWHVRTGDIVLHNSIVYYENLASQLRNVLLRIPFQVFFFGENVIDSFPFLADVCKNVLHCSCSFPVVSVADTLHHFIHADILVTSGSSFPIVASLLRDIKPTFAVVPKEGSRVFAAISEEIRVSESGLFENHTSRQEIRARITRLVASKVVKSSILAE
jgi:hypothetical protein